MTMNLFVSNLSPETTEADLHERFAEFGQIIVSKVLKDRETGVSRGFGFVEFADVLMAVDAIDNLDQSFLKGNIISVKEAKQKTDDRGGKSRPAFSKERFNKR